MSLEVADLLERVDVPELQVAAAARAHQQIVVVVVLDVVERTNPVFVTIVNRLF